MPKDGSVTRHKILDTAQDLILERGYAGVSIDRLIDRIGITKGGFFYHFPNKNELAWSLIQRFQEQDLNLMQEFTGRAKKLGRDPLQQMLIFVGLFEDMFEEQDFVHPGCLFASYTHELHQFDERTRKLIADTFIEWRGHMEAWFRKIAEQHPPRIPVDLTSLADEFTVILEGAFVSAKMLQDANVIPQQLAHYRNYLELLFAPSDERQPVPGTA